MPIQQGIDEVGEYYQFGDQGKKYYFTNSRNMNTAYMLAKKQGQAISISKKYRNTK